MPLPPRRKVRLRSPGMCRRTEFAKLEQAKVLFLWRFCSMGKIRARTYHFSLAIVLLLAMLAVACSSTSTSTPPPGPGTHGQWVRPAFNGITSPFLSAVAFADANQQEGYACTAT